MSKCIETSEAQAAREQSQGAAQETPVPFLPSATEYSPLLRALRSHFEKYAGLTEPKIDTLRPQTDDL
jgi:hypothetical protein